MKFLLIIYLLSSGYYQERHVSEESCEDTLKLTHVLYGNDLWSGTCVGPDDEITMQISAEIDPWFAIALRLASEDERRMWMRFGIAQFKPDDPRVKKIETAIKREDT